MNSDDLTVAILAGGDSSRFGSQKALAMFRNKPLISHMVQVASTLTSRILIIVSNENQTAEIHQLHPDIEVVTDPVDSTRSALNGAVTAFEFAETRYTLLLPVDTPLVHRDLVTLMLSLRGNNGAVIPSWPNGYVEPLHGVYLTEHAYTAGFRILESGKRKMQQFLNALTNVLYISTEVLRAFDPELLSFANINTPADLKQLELKL